MTFWHHGPGRRLVWASVSHTGTGRLTRLRQVGDVGDLPHKRIALH